MRIPDFHVICGTVDRILGSHDTMDITITEHETTHDPYGGDPAYLHLRRTEKHVFVNSKREFVMLLEVGGQTLKLVSGDYLAVASGDQVRAICEKIVDGPMFVRDWHNVTRSIRFRNLPTPLNDVAHLIICAICVVVGSTIIYLLFDRSFILLLIAAIAWILGGWTAFTAFQGAQRIADIHALLDELGIDEAGANKSGDAVLAVG